MKISLPTLALRALVPAVVFGVALVRSWSGLGELVVEPQDADLGVHVQGEVIEQEFTLSNRGSGPCRIVTALASCACIGVRGTPDVLQPGEKAKVVVLFDTSAKVGYITSRVTFVHDGNNGPRAVVAVKGTVNEGMSLSPSRWDVPRSEARDDELGEETGAAIDVVVSTDCGLDLSSLEVHDDFGLVALASTSVVSPCRRDVRLHLRRPLPVGPFKAAVRFRVGRTERYFLVEGSLSDLQAAVPATVFLRADVEAERRTTFRLPLGVDQRVEVERSPDAVVTSVIDSPSTGATVSVALRDDPKICGGHGYIVLWVRPADAVGEAGDADAGYRVQVPVKWDCLRPYSTN